MRSETTYYANDETEFDSEEECLAYEAALKNASKSVHFFDEHQARMSNATPEDVCNYSIYAKIIDAELAKKHFKWLYEFVGMTVPKIELHNGDVIKWDGESDDWVNLSDHVKRLQTELRNIQEEICGVSEWG